MYRSWQLSCLQFRLVLPEIGTLRFLLLSLL